MPRQPAPSPQHTPLEEVPLAHSPLEHAPHEGASHGSPQHPAPDRWETTRRASVEQAIREKAYELYCARQGGPGSATDDWLRAEAGMQGVGGRPADDR